MPVVVLNHRDHSHLRVRPPGSFDFLAGVHTLHPKAYYLMEIDADGNRLTEPQRMDGTGWGGMDEMVSLGNGKVGWAYIPNPELHSDGTYTDPYQNDWEFMVYQSQQN